VPFFQTSSLLALRQLSMSPAAAKAEPATVKAASASANLFSFFMVLLLGKKSAANGCDRIKRFE
jgi:hypothetical protein